jgi:hypothetical protein
MPSMTVDRRRVIALMVASVLTLVLSIALRASIESPFAPRVRVRWTPAIAESRRVDLEREFWLFRGTRAEGDTWEYDLVDPSPASVAALIANPDVRDTHYIDRARTMVASDAPIGTIRVRERRLAALVHSILFDWFLLFWASAILVSGVWLASDAAHD